VSEMAEEIISKLGLDVSSAVTGLMTLATKLTQSATALNTHAAALGKWNTVAVQSLKIMQGLAAASGKLGKMPAPTAAPTAARGLPPGLAAQTVAANKAMDDLGSTSTKTGKKIAEAGGRGTRALKDTHGASSKLIMSLEMMGRIVITQAIVRALSQIRNMLQLAVAESVEFQKAISEVLLITMAPLEGSMRETTSTFQSLTEESANMARRFNVDLSQAVEGMYQTISNQFTEATERTHVMDASMKLAKIGVVDLKDSVLLMTGALNAYGKSSSEAERVAAMFFRTIQLGRVRGKELADTLGTVIPVAAQLGVSLEEVTSSFVSLTIGGINAHKASTGLRQAMLAFLKPSEDMKKVLRELGYANAEQIIQAKTFVGALKAVSEASKGMASEFAKSIRRVRALTVALALTRDDAKAYEKAVETMSKSSAEHLDELWIKYKEMPAEKLTHDINAIKVTLTQDLGAALIDTLNRILQFVGGADSLIVVLKAVTATAIALGVALIVLAAKAALAHMALGPVGIAMLALSVAIGVVTAATAYNTAAIRRNAEEQRKSAEEEITKLEKKRQKERKAAFEAMREANSQYEEMMASLRKNYFSAIDDLKRKNKDLVEDTRQSTSAMVRAQDRVVAAYRNAAKAAADAVRASRERQIEGEAAYSDAVFKYANKNERAYQKAEKYMSRARILAREAEKAMRKAATPEQIAAAGDIFDRAEAAAQEAENIAGGTKYVTLQKDAQRNILFLMRQKIDAEKELQKLQAEQAMRLAKEAAKEQKRLSTMKSLMKAILEDLQAFDKGEARDPAIMKQQQERLEKNLALLRKEWAGRKGADVSEMMSFDKLQQRVQSAIEGGVTTAEVRKVWASAETFATFRKDIEDGMGPIRILVEAKKKLPARIQKMMEGETVEKQVQILSSELRKTTDVIMRYKEMSTAVEIANKKVSQNWEAAQAIVKEWVEVGERRPEHLTASTAWQKAKIKPVGRDFFKAMKKFSEMSESQFDESAFAEMQEKYKAYVKKIQPPIAAQEVLDKFMEQAGAAAAEATVMSDLLEGLRGAEGAGTGFEASAMEAKETARAIGDAIIAAKLAESRMQKAKAMAKFSKEETLRLKEAAGDARDKVSAAAGVDMSSVVSQTSAWATAMWDVASAAAAVQMSQSAELSARGGRVGRYFAAGGPVGTDVVPTWLSRGEFVMNAKSANRFASQLVAMNAGVQPAFRGEGGSVTNIGDINVTVQGGTTGRQTARSIAAELRRELRRGTTTL